ncbi:MAG: NAD-dependent epimerase/dehydratase family protein [Desulfobacterales bacterium]|nr:NAD-dependent epimerase/dehydratase family protein [Desulfobacterales bacterium]
MLQNHESIKGSLNRPQHPERVLVTGGGGFLGYALCERLRARGDRVASFSRSRYPELDQIGVSQIEGDLRDEEEVARACRDVDAVFHTAAKAGVWGRYEDYFSVNVTGTRNVLAACRKNKIPRLIHTSSPSVVFNGNDMAGVNESAPYPARFHAAYPETKAAAEKEVTAAGRQAAPMTITIRPHLIWGPRDNHLVPRIIERAHRLKRIGPGDNRVDTIYIDNAALAHVLAADRLAEAPELSGRVYFVSQDEPIPVWDMVNRILAAAGKPPVKGAVSFRAAWTAGLVLETVYRLFLLKGEPPMTRFVARELATDHWFDISAAKRDLGYRPEVSTEEGLRRLAEWLQAEARNPNIE